MLPSRNPGTPRAVSDQGFTHSKSSLSCHDAFLAPSCRQQKFCESLSFSRGFPGGSAGKKSTCDAGDLGSIPGLGRPPGEGNGYPLQYSERIVSILENSMDCMDRGVTKSRTWLSDFHFHMRILAPWEQGCLSALFSAEFTESRTVLMGARNIYWMIEWGDWAGPSAIKLAFFT